jgi:hypothetical protein
VTGQIPESTRAEALFASTMQRSDPPNPQTVRDAIRSSVRRHGARGCAAIVAYEFGEHPDTAVGRMCWALDTVRSTASPARTRRGAAMAGR